MGALGVYRVVQGNGKERGKTNNFYLFHYIGLAFQVYAWGCGSWRIIKQLPQNRNHMPSHKSISDKPPRHEADDLKTRCAQDMLVVVFADNPPARAA